MAQLEEAERKEAEERALLHPYNRSTGRCVVAKVLAAGKDAVGRTLVVGGWVKTGRKQGGGAFAFLELNDGSTPTNLQLKVDAAVAEPLGGLGALTTTGTSVVAEGELKAAPEGAKQEVEVHVTKVLFSGPCDGAKYPIAKKKTTFEYLRERLHLRPRTNTIAAVARIRNALSYATHRFFQEQGFLYVHTPIITASDCEGAGEMFQITTLLSEAAEVMQTPALGPAELAARAEATAAKGAELKEAKAALKEDKENGELGARVKALVAELLELKEKNTKAQDRASKVGGLPWKDGKIDYSKDFFGGPANLTVSGQLQGENYACALTSIYTFGPTFRAEYSHTTRHLSEFWMIEPELAFADIHDDMSLAEDYIKYCCAYVLDHCQADMEFFTKMIDKTAIARLQNVRDTPFVRITYTEACEMLIDAIKTKKKKFENNVVWGVDLNSEHERWLAEEVFKGPVIVYNYPKDIKAFYMKLNDDQKTVAAMDILVPGVGELVGGSQREENVDILIDRIEKGGMDMKDYEAYLDLRRYGTVPHSGFGLGFERLICFTTGLENIREVIPFPRWPGHAAG